MRLIWLRGTVSLIADPDVLNGLVIPAKSRGNIDPLWQCLLHLGKILGADLQVNRLNLVNLIEGGCFFQGIGSRLLGYSRDRQRHKLSQQAGKKTETAGLG